MKNLKEALYNHYRKSLVYPLIFIALMIAGALMVILPVQDHLNYIQSVQASTIIQEYKVVTLTSSNKQKDLEIETISMAVKVATASGTAHNLTKDEAKEMIATMFPVQFRERFAKITMECENGKLNTAATHVNKDGTEDVGMAQINNKWHQKRVQAMFGMDFDVAMRIPILNYIYATYLVDHDQNLHQWACNQIVS